MILKYRVEIKIYTMTNRVLILQASFCSDENSLGRSKESWNSIVEIVKEWSGTPPDVRLSGWIKSGNIMEASRQHLKGLDLEKNLFAYSENVGKSRVINDAMMNSRHDWVICIDSDIILKDGLRLKQLIETCEEYNIDFCAMNQQGDCRHCICVDVESNIHAGFKFLHPKDGVGLAGGAVIIRGDVLRKTPMPIVGVYGPDDISHINMLEKNGTRCWLVENYHAEHPADVGNPQYLEWKHETAWKMYHKLGWPPRSMTCEEYDDCKNLADGFWKENAK